MNTLIQAYSVTHLRGAVMNATARVMAADHDCPSQMRSRCISISIEYHVVWLYDINNTIAKLPTCLYVISIHGKPATSTGETVEVLGTRTEPSMYPRPNGDLQQS